MGASHKCKAKKTNLQKKVKLLQAERDELIAKLLKYECTIKERDQYIEQITNKYEQTIHDLKSELGESETSREKSDIFKKRISDWMYYGVFFSIAPFTINVCTSMFFGYDIRLADSLTDFLFVLFAVSVNFISATSDSAGCSDINQCCRSFVALIAAISFELPIFLLLMSIPKTYSLLGREILEKTSKYLTQESNINVVFCSSAFLLVVVIALGIFIIVRQDRKQINISD